LAEVQRIERKYSRYAATSTLSAINAVGAAGGEVDIDDETAALLDHAFACYTHSGGLFDITSGALRRCWDFTAQRLPPDAAIQSALAVIGLEKLQWNRPRLSFGVAGMEIDFGGIGKEYAVDRVSSVLGEAGITGGLVDLGGDLKIIGPHPDDSPWRIGVRDPREPRACLVETALMQGAVATSGDYERCMEIDGRRYNHIFDPRNGWPVEGLISVSVVADSCLLAGSLATIAMLKGRDGPAWLGTLGVVYHWVAADGSHGGNLPPPLGS
jgi:thiamine biosynthesis lipoprotein